MMINKRKNFKVLNKSTRKVCNAIKSEDCKCMETDFTHEKEEGENWERCCGNMRIYMITMTTMNITKLLKM